MDWSSIEPIILESTLSSSMISPLVTTPAHLKHEWDPMLTDHPVTTLTPSSEDIDFFAENAEDKRLNACTFWNELISYHQGRSVVRGFGIQDISEPCPAVEGHMQLQSSAQGSKDAMFMPQVWGLPMTGVTHFPLVLPPPPPSQVHTLDALISAPPTLQNTSIPIVDISLINQSLNLQNLSAFQANPSYIPPTPMSIDDSSHYFEEKFNADNHFDTELISQPQLDCTNALTLPSPQSPPPKCKTKKTDPMKRQAATIRGLCYPKSRPKLEQEGWYIKYKSPSRDPETGKFYCLGCRPERVYHFETNSQLSRHATQHRFTGENKRYRCSGCKDGRRFDRMDALQRHMVQGEMYQECLKRGLYSEYDEYGECVRENSRIPDHWLTAAINRTRKDLEKKQEFFGKV